MSNLVSDPMATIYSVFAETGNIINWFDDRGAALEYLAQVGRENPEVADAVFMIGDPDDPEWEHGIVIASELLAEVS
jgi:hypothetical protein